jgi:hypothetical protein
LGFIATDLLTDLRLADLLSLNLSSIDGRPGERRLAEKREAQHRQQAPTARSRSKGLKDAMD